MEGLRAGVALGDFLRSNSLLEKADAPRAFRERLKDADAVAVILAAGKGTRFTSSLPKVVHPCRGIPMAAHSLRAARGAGLPAVLVVGYEKETVVRKLAPWMSDDLTAVAEDALRVGTGHAVFVASLVLPESFDGDVVVLYGDNPGIGADLITSLFEYHRRRKNAEGPQYGATILTGSRAHVRSGGKAYGRIVRNSSGNVVDIVEKKQIDRMTEGQLWEFARDLQLDSRQLDEIDEFNSGIVVARAKPYFNLLGEIKAVQTSTEPVQKFEFYATDFVKMMVARNMTVGAWLLEPSMTWKVEGANTLDELQSLETRMKEALAE